MVVSVSGLGCGYFYHITRRDNGRMYGDGEIGWRAVMPAKVRVSGGAGIFEPRRS